MNKNEKLMTLGYLIELELYDDSLGREAGTVFLAIKSKGDLTEYIGQFAPHLTVDNFREAGRVWMEQ